MAGYGWAAYDVRRGGTHVVNDTGNMIDLTTQFVKIPNEKRYGNWGLRIKGIPRADAGTKKKTTVIFYLGSEDPSSRIACVKTTTSNSAVVCKDTAKGPGNFMLQILDNRDGPDILGSVAVKSLKVPENTIWQAKSIFGDQLQAGGSHMGVVGNDPGEGNLHFLQGSFDGGFEFDVLFSSDISTMTSTILTNSIQDMMSAFAESFQLIYAPQSPFKDEQHIRFSQVLLSNLMGGIGYFSGTSKAVVSSAPEFAETRPNFWEKADSAHSRNIVEEQGPFQLFSAVPSRPFFPRGFLWDEGFHLLVILDWDMDLALEIVSSWFQLMDENGWIAREQILGQESRSKVPSEFQTQYPHFANPPTLFLVVEAFVARLSGEVSYSGAPSRHLRDPAAGKAFLNGIYPKLKKNYDWFCRTQAGNLEKYHRLPGSDFIKGYRWRGRTPQHTLTSGLDDFPRAQPPHPDELHLDALCWVGSMAAALKKISSFTGEKGADQDQAMFLKHETDVIRSFDRTHWSETNQAYCDTTVVEENRVEKVCHKGYISLFPFLVGLMGPDHPHLEAMLHLIRDPEELWSPHGIRSLSLKDKYYGTDENYWRGPVWININYMVVQELLVSVLPSSPPLPPPLFRSKPTITNSKRSETRSTARPTSTKSTANILRPSTKPSHHRLRILERNRLCLGTVQPRHRPRTKDAALHGLDFTDCENHVDA
ncbi:Processing alpha glucosidase I [Bachmanniomyces sp. S44760]|nr:Processing alpha glucosidase I [Bachmanniomyces sp. S44760]